MQNKYNIPAAVISRMPKRASILRDNIFLVQVGAGTNVYNDFMVSNSNKIKQKTSQNFFLVEEQKLYGTICGLNAGNLTGYVLRRKGRQLRRRKIFQKQDFFGQIFPREMHVRAAIHSS